MASFMAMVYAVLKENNIDINGMSPSDAVEKFNELQGSDNSINEEKSTSSVKFIKEVDKKENKIDNNTTQRIKLAVDSPDAKKVYEDISSGKYYSEIELKNHPVVKELDRISDDFYKNYGNTIDIKTPKREALRQIWEKDFLKTGSYSGRDADNIDTFNGEIKREFKATIIIGLPAAGKSSRLANPLSKELGAFILDSDEIKQRIPEYVESNGGAANSVHEESKLILKNATEKFFKGGGRNGDNIIIPIIGSDTNKLINKWIKPFEESGYDVEVKYQDADPNKSLNRVIMRAIKTGRIIPTSEVFSYGDKPRAVFEELKKIKGAGGKPYVR